eukprot:m.46563 g.46563  ORF g.46563 m.46563 type:complete len:153 (+) comp10726_c1_seq2:229-687(+)
MAVAVVFVLLLFTVVIVFDVVCCQFCLCVKFNSFNYYLFVFVFGCVCVYFSFSENGLILFLLASCSSLCGVEGSLPLSSTFHLCEKKERVVPSTPSSAYHVHTLFVIDVDVLVNLGLLICLFLLKTLRLLFDRIGLERSSCGPTLSFQTMNR